MLKHGYDLLHKVIIHVNIYNEIHVNNLLDKFTLLEAYVLRLRCYCETRVARQGNCDANGRGRGI